MSFVGEEGVEGKEEECNEECFSHGTPVAVPIQTRQRERLTGVGLGGTLAPMVESPRTTPTPGASLEFPVMDGPTPYAPRGRECPWCGLAPVHEPNSMAIINGGALLMSEDRLIGGMDPRLDGFLSLIWHGAHEGGHGQWRDRCSMVRVADGCRGGQFEMYFCSTGCLRGFLNDCVDRLEARREEDHTASGVPPAGSGGE
jgi:hypothetical protein